jgi:hypothetical protein
VGIERTPIEENRCVGPIMRPLPLRKPDLEENDEPDERPREGATCDLPLFPRRSLASTETAKAALTTKARKRTFCVFIMWGSGDWTGSLIEPFN